MKKRIAVLIAVSSLTLAQCSLFKHRPAPYPSGLVFPLAQDSVVSYQGKIISPARHNGGQVFFATQSGFVNCLEGLKRTLLWSFKADHPFSFPPCLGPASVYIVDQENILYCLGFDGSLSWKKSMDVKVSTPLVFSGDLLFCGAGDSNIVALSLSGRGEPAWRYNPGVALTSGPIVGEGMVFFGAENGKLYSLDTGGKFQAAFDIKEKLAAPPLISGGRLYFGTDGRFFYCLDAKKGKRKWRAKLGGTVSAAPVIYGGRLLVPASNSVLYCLNKHSGSILWWRIIPSRYSYDLEIAEKKVAVASLAPVLAAFDLEKGMESGEFKAGQDLQANVLWLDPYLILHQFDFPSDTGTCLFLKKDVQVGLNTEKTSPQPVGEEIGCSVYTVGFYRPRFEFYVKAGDTRTVLQKESAKGSCVWFPDREGTYLLGVKVMDEKQTREVEIPFVVEKKPEK